MKRLVSILMFTLCVSVPALPVDYCSGALEAIANKSGIADKIPQGKDTTLYLPFHDKRIVVRTDVKCVNHIGICLFDGSYRQVADSQICDFIERYVLEAELNLPDDKPVKKKLKEDKVSFSKGDMAYLAHLNANSREIEFTIENQQKSIQFSVYRNKNLRCQMVIPKNYELISGKSIIELERDLFSDIGSQCVVQRINKQAYSFKQIELPTLLVTNSTCFLTDLLSNSLYFNKKDTSLLFDPHINYRQSIANIMLLGHTNNYQLDIKYHVYGNKIISHKQPLNCWIELASRHGCTPYWGILESKNDKIKGAYYWYNQAYGYVHIMTVEFPVNKLIQKNAELRTTLYPYVRITNIQNFNQLY